MILRFFLDIVNGQEAQQIIGLVIKPIQVKEIYNGLSAMFQNDASVSTMKTRSKTLPQINWDSCNFCRQIASNRVSLPFSVSQDKLSGVFI
jgi:hypothetical protein